MAVALAVVCGACSSSESSGGGDVPGLGVGAAGSSGLSGLNTGAGSGAGVGVGTSGTAAPTAGAAGAPLAGAPGSGAAGTPGVTAGVGGTDGTAGAGGVAGLDTGTAGMEVAGAAGMAVDTPPTPPAGDTCLLPGNGNYTSPGPYQVGTMDVDLGMVNAGQTTGMYTIFYPMPLEASCLHPIVAWGNGTAVTGSAVYAFLNENAASWGIVVAASQDPNTGSGNFHKAGIDYLLAQNQDPSSMFYQKLSTRAGVSGHSQGGIGANAGAAHPNVETAAIEGMSMVATAKVSALVLTGTADIVMGVEDSVPRAQGPMFVANWEGGDHFTTETLAGFIVGDAGSLQFQRLYAAWFRCFLADDQVACGLFAGGTPNGCGICNDPGWHALASNIP